MIQQFTNGKVPSRDDIQSLIMNAVELRRLFASCTCAINRTHDRKRALRFRPGGEKMVRLVADIADGLRFTVPGVTTEEMRSLLEFSQQLEPLQVETSRLARTVEDAIFEAQSECWSILYAYYSALKKVSRVHPDLRVSLREAVDFFATGRRASDEDSAESPVHMVVEAEHVEVNAQNGTAASDDAERQPEANPSSPAVTQMS